MYRQTSTPFRSLWLRSVLSQGQQVRHTSWRAASHDGNDNESRSLEIESARKWASNLKESAFPQAIVRFDRSSGKGGQHVNKTNSKATCRWEMRNLGQFVPKILHEELRKSSYYAPASDSLVIQAQTSRSQHDNERECYGKLHQLVQEAIKKVIPGETSLEQKAKVERLQKAENEARKTMKKEHSAKKQSRTGAGRGDY